MAAMSSLRMPKSLSAALKVETGEAVLRYELLQEQAAALGRMGEKLQTALAALREADDVHRPAALKTAAEACWCFFVQRDVMGLKDRAAVIAHYAIPREVLNRIGAR